MPKIDQYKSLIENEFSELFKKHKFVMKYEDDHKIEYSNDKCIMKFTVDRYYFDYSLDLCDPNEKKHQGYATWLIIEALNLKGNAIEAKEKRRQEREQLRKKESTFSPVFLDENDFIKNIKESAKEVEQYLGFVLEGDFSFKEKYDKWNNDFPL